MQAGPASLRRRFPLRPVECSASTVHRSTGLRPISYSWSTGQCHKARRPGLGTVPCVLARAPQPLRSRPGRGESGCIRGGQGNGSETAARANGLDSPSRDGTLAFRPLDRRKLRIPRLRDANAVPDRMGRYALTASRGRGVADMRARYEYRVAGRTATSKKCGLLPSGGAETSSDQIIVRL